MSSVGLKRAIILAAGQGRRLYPHTEHLPKPLTTVGGVSMLARQFAALESLGVSQVVVITGHGDADIRAFVSSSSSTLEISIVYNERYASTNNIYSLWLAREYFDKDVLLLESDIVLSAEHLLPLMEAPGGSNVALVSPKTYFMEGACVELKGVPPKITPPKQLIKELVRPHHYKTVNIYRLSSAFLTGWLGRALADVVERGALGDYYEALFAKGIVEGQCEFHAALLASDAWFEVDNADDLDIAQFGVSDNAIKRRLLEGRHGGYWRYSVKDHCLLYNFHYPPPKLIDHMQARFEFLLREYPSAQKPIAAFVAAYYGIATEHTVVANGLSELIPMLFGDRLGSVVVPVPSFNEYEAVVPPDRLRRLHLCQANDFELDGSSIAQMAIEEGASHVLITTPNNPTGNAMPRAELVRLLDVMKERSIRVLVDESFVDFHENGRAESVLDLVPDYPNLIVVWSLSKSHGVGGIRLGVMATSDSHTLSAIRDRLPIWNVNAFAEQYVRIFSAFRDEFLLSCKRVRMETDELRRSLGAISGVRTYATQANFVFCRLDPEVATASELVGTLLEMSGIYIKDCSGKSMPNAEQFFRISSRTARENNVLVHAIRLAVDRLIAREWHAADHG